MINIRFTDAWLTANPSLTKGFLLSLGDNDYPVPSNSRYSTDPSRAVVNGSLTQINLRPGETFSIQNEIFETLVKSNESGGDTNLITRILHFVNMGVLQVMQGTTPLTSKQIVNYTAP